MNIIAGLSIIWVLIEVFGNQNYTDKRTGKIPTEPLWVDTVFGMIFSAIVGGLFTGASIIDFLGEGIYTYKVDGGFKVAWNKMGTAFEKGCFLVTAGSAFSGLVLYVVGASLYERNHWIMISGWIIGWLQWIFGSLMGGYMSKVRRDKDRIMRA